VLTWNSELYISDICTEILDFINMYFNISDLFFFKNWIMIIKNVHISEEICFIAFHSLQTCLLYT
jgi:hypothetical protein